MSNYNLFDTNSRLNLLPFTHTRPIADIRCGIFTMRERWEKLINHKTGTLTVQYLQEVFHAKEGGDNIFINGTVFGTVEMLSAINSLHFGQKLVKDQIIIAARIEEDFNNLDALNIGIDKCLPVEFNQEIGSLKNIWDIFSLNDKYIRSDFKIITEGRETVPLPDNIIVSGRENLFLEPGAKIGMGCIINASRGPVYLAKDAELLEGVMLHGPLAIGEHGVVKMGAKLYGATTIGAGCKVGGELNNVVLFANSNKGHDGYLGNAVIGEWCNLGADTNCSNLKNNYDEIKVWSEYENKLVKTGLVFCGLMMGDHSKCGINTMFNTGTVVGVSANIYGGNFPDKFIPSFSWGGETMVTYEFDKAMETANRMMARRNRQLSEIEMELFKYIFNNTAVQRNN